MVGRDSRCRQSAPSTLPCGVCVRVRTAFIHTDLIGKIRNEPVYALLGGKTKDRLPVYCTTARPDLAKDFGFVGAKVPCPYGPAAGDEGFRKNVAFFKEWREKVGPDFPLMLDCYMALTVPYTIKVGVFPTAAAFGVEWNDYFYLECI